MQRIPIPDEVAESGADGRTAIRINLFMAATMSASGVETAVKIRDLSASGAQVESAVIPDIGSPMTLARGRFSVRGHVTWCAGRRCGLHFTSRISVQDWLANPVNRQQQRVDRIVTAVKGGAVPLVAPAIHEAGTADRIADDLTRVSQLLDNLGDALAGDPGVVTQHGIALQNLDIAMQTLTVLAETLRAGAQAGGVSIARLDELRTSCSEALANT